MIIAIDPGNVESAYVLMTDEYEPIEFSKSRNEEVRDYLTKSDCKELVIEMVASYGMPVGATVFETCVEIGRLIQIADLKQISTTLVYRREVKRNICGVVTAKDANIIQALIDRFAKNTPNRGKGTKKDPGYFYGFKADIWQAYALGVTYLDLKEQEHE